MLLRPRTVLRLILYVGLNWLVLALLYAGLPNFSRNDNGTDYATKVLKSGGTLTRVYGKDDYFYNNEAVDFPGDNVPRRNLVLTFQIDSVSDELIISGNGRVPLARPAQLTAEQEQQEQSYGAILLEPAIIVSAPAGDTDGINLPWFDTADAVLMYHLISRDQASVSLRAVVRQDGGKFEVWPDGDDGWMDPLSKPGSHPLLSLVLDRPNDNRASHLSTASVPPSPFSVSPSRTYLVRLTILIILAPLTIVVMGAFFVVRSIVSLVLGFFSQFFWVLVFLLLVRWVYKGKPPVSDYLREVIDDVAMVLQRGRTWIGSWFSSRGGSDEEKTSSIRENSSNAESEVK